jgi:hypothetical protein
MQAPMRIHVQSGAIGEGVVAPVDASVEAAAGKAAAAAGSPGKLKLFLATKAGKITAGVAAFVVVASIALGVGLGLGLKKSSGLTANIGGATALYVVPKSGSSSGRRLLQNEGVCLLRGSDGKPVALKVRSPAYMRVCTGGRCPLLTQAYPNDMNFKTSTPQLSDFLTLLDLLTDIHT